MNESKCRRCGLPLQQEESHRHRPGVLWGELCAYCRTELQNADKLRHRDREVVNRSRQHAWDLIYGRVHCSVCGKQLRRGDPHSYHYGDLDSDTARTSETAICSACLTIQQQHAIDTDHEERIRARIPELMQQWRESDG